MARQTINSIKDRTYKDANKYHKTHSSDIEFSRRLFIYDAFSLDNQGNPIPISSQTDYERLIGSINNGNITVVLVPSVRIDPIIAVQQMSSERHFETDQNDINTRLYSNLERTDRTKAIFKQANKGFQITSDVQLEVDSEKVEVSTGRKFVPPEIALYVIDRYSNLIDKPSGEQVLTDIVQKEVKRVDIKGVDPLNANNILFSIEPIIPRGFIKLRYYFEGRSVVEPLNVFENLTAGTGGDQYIVKTAKWFKMNELGTSNLIRSPETDKLYKMIQNIAGNTFEPEIPDIGEFDYCKNIVELSSLESRDRIAEAWFSVEKTSTREGTKDFYLNNVDNVGGVNSSWQERDGDKVDYATFDKYSGPIGNQSINNVVDQINKHKFPDASLSITSSSKDKGSLYPADFPEIPSQIQTLPINTSTHRYKDNAQHYFKLDFAHLDTGLFAGALRSNAIIYSLVSKNERLDLLAVENAGRDMMNRNPNFLGKNYISVYNDLIEQETLPSAELPYNDFPNNFHFVFITTNDINELNELVDKEANRKTTIEITTGSGNYLTSWNMPNPDFHLRNRLNDAKFFREQIGRVELDFSTNKIVLKDGEVFVLEVELDVPEPVPIVRVIENFLHIKQDHIIEFLDENDNWPIVPKLTTLSKSKINAFVKTDKQKKVWEKMLKRNAYYPKAYRILQTEETIYPMRITPNSLKGQPLLKIYRIIFAV